MNYLYKKSAFLLIPALLVFFASCDDSSSGVDTPQQQKVTVNMQITSGSATSAKMMARTAQAQNVELTEVKLLVEELELESSVDQDSLDFEVNDLVVDLPLDGSKFEVVSGQVPEGLYGEFEMEIEGPDDGSSVDDTDFYDESGNGDDGYSIVVKGTFNGEEFVYRTKKDFELELELNSPLEVTASSSPSVAINIDPYSWFKDSAGNAIDPSDPANQEVISQKIDKSFGVELDQEQDDNDENGDTNDNDDTNDDNDDNNN